MFHAIVFRPEGESCIDELTSSLLALSGHATRPADVRYSAQSGRKADMCDSQARSMR
jgi:hypothetical protein